jgi:two-component system chemotaxis response regulator CheY
MRRPKRILIVDDDAGIRDMIDLALSTEGYEVVTAAHGAAALDAVRRTPPDLILLDIKMPVMSGTEFSKAYRGLPGVRAPIVVLTAAPFAESRAAEIGAEAFIGKPFDLNALLKVVKLYAHA